MNYNDYLQGEHWKLMRRLRREVDNEQCAVCGNNNSLNVHHKTYDRIGTEKLSDLITLCQECHAKYHDKLGKGNFSVKKTFISNKVNEPSEFERFELENESVKATIKNGTLEPVKAYLNGKFIGNIPALKKLNINEIETGLCEFTFTQTNLSLARIEMIEMTKEIESEKENAIICKYSDKDLKKFVEDLNSMARYKLFDQEQSNFFNKYLAIEGIMGFIESNFNFNHVIDIGNFELIKLLVQKGYNFKRIRSGYTTPLNQAIRMNKRDIFNYLLENGAEANNETLSWIHKNGRLKEWKKEMDIISKMVL